MRESRTGEQTSPRMTTAHGDVGEVTAIRQALEAAENGGDADALAALLTDDAVLMVPDFPAQEGKAACIRFVRGIMSWLLGRTQPEPWRIARLIVSRNEDNEREPSTTTR
jgi:ketosteroid isomerase-like protein